MRPHLPAPVVAFLAGGAIMAVELLLPRLSARHLGTSAEVWTAVFAVVLGGIALGNSLGGRLADARPSPRTEAVVLLLAGASVAAIPTLDRVAESAFAGASLLPRSLLSIALCALVPTTLLGAISPLLARNALATSRHPGRTLGILAAAGAGGSVLGTYLTGFVLVPTTATGTSISLLAGVLGFAALARAFAPSGSAAAAAAVGARDSRPAADAVPFARCTILAALAGVAVLLVEVTAARIASRMVGNSVYTWTAVIGAVLAGLCAGNAIGGSLADRFGARRVLPPLLLVGSVLTAATIWTPIPLAVLARDPGDSLPSRIVVGAVLAWLIPSAALGALTPVAARAALRGDGRDGRRIGALYAINTLGAVAGSVLTSPFLVPLLGVPAALLVAAIALALAPRLVGGAVERPWIAGLAVATLAATLPLGVAVFSPAVKLGTALGLREDESAVLVLESRYGNVRVQALEGTEYAPPGRPRTRSLVLDGLVHGLVDLDDPTWLGYGYENVYAALTERLLPEGRLARALFIGGGTYTFPTWLLARRPSASADVAEIDPAVTLACRRVLALGDRPGLAIRHEDARTYVRDLPAGAPAYDLVYGDAFNDVSVPFHLTTVEFTRAIAAHLAPDGAYLMNVIDSRSSGAFVGALVTTLRTVFAHVAVLSPDAVARTRDTFVVVASQRPLPLDGLARRDGLAPADAPTIPVHRFSEVELEIFAERAGHLVLTDAFAPVEALLAPTVRRSTGR